MKLERYKDKKETRKKVILISLTVVTLVSITMVLYKTFAKFTTTTSFPIMSGKVIYKKKILDLTDIVPGESGDGELYKVEHGGDSGWTKAELRYVGKNPNNYVYFNCDDEEADSADTCELWRIIGLVNVQTSSGTIVQRLKIMRYDSIGKYSWDGGSIKYKDGNWSESTLKAMLNDGYYNSSNSYYCYSSSSSSSLCSFSNNSPKGLREKARDMIDKDTSWGYANEYTHRNLEGYSASGWYSVEHRAYWNKSNDGQYKGVALISPSDYGYAVGGDVREACLMKLLSSYKENNCYTNNWIWRSGNTYWTFQGVMTYGASLYYQEAVVVEVTGHSTHEDASWASGVNPTVYLTEKWALSGGDGSFDNPYYLVAKS